MKTQIAKLKNNPIGVLVGLGAGYLVAKKLVKTDKLWLVIASSVLGAFGGAMAQSAFKSNQASATIATTATAPKK